MKIIDAKLKFGNGTVRSGKPNGIALHHAAVKTASVETIHRGHLDKGWIGIGYHFYVRKDGSVYRGRPEDWVGAHTSGHNATKLGICAEGNFEVEEMPAAQKNAIIELLAYLFGKYGDLKVYGHRDLNATACPGKNYPFDEIVSGAKNFGKAEAPEALYRVFDAAGKQVGAYAVEANAFNEVKRQLQAGGAAKITLREK